MDVKRIAHFARNREKPMTWGDVLDYAVAQGYAQDEYFDLSVGNPKSLLDEPVWDSSTSWISVFWVVGDSEGYYVHVERIIDKGQRQLVLLGKFWDWERAMACVNELQRLVNY